MFKVSIIVIKRFNDKVPFDEFSSKILFSFYNILYKIFIPTV